MHWLSDKYINLLNKFGLFPYKTLFIPTPFYSLKINLFFHIKSFIHFGRLDQIISYYFLHLLAKERYWVTQIFLNLPLPEREFLAVINQVIVSLQVLLDLRVESLLGICGALTIHILWHRWIISLNFPLQNDHAIMQLSAVFHQWVYLIVFS